MKADSRGLSNETLPVNFGLCNNRASGKSPASHRECATDVHQKRAKSHANGGKARPLQSDPSATSEQTIAQDQTCEIGSSTNREALEGRGGTSRPAVTKSDGSGRWYGA
jgi:hypothetical protein